MEKYDLVVIGSGSGLLVVEAAVAHNLRCALIEKAKVGGTCLTKGCIPSKMLVYPADVIREAQAARKAGLVFGSPQIDWKMLSERVWKQINYSVSLEKSLLEIDHLSLYKGDARFVGPHRIEIRRPGHDTADVIEGDKIVIAAGARSFVPPVEGIDPSDIITPETFFGDQYPAHPWESLVMIGGGAIGCEFAHIFSAFGTKVTLIEMKPRLLFPEEEEISKFVQEQFEANGIHVMTNARIISGSKAGMAKSLTIENILTHERVTISSEAVFAAAGIRPNSDLLDIQNAGVATDASGWIQTGRFLETSQPDIWAIGDINGKYQFRHKANYEADILIHNLLHAEGKKKEIQYTSVPWAIFTCPQVAHVGLTEREVLASGEKYKVGRNFYSEVAGGIAMGFSKHDPDNGFVKIIVGEDQKILGVHIAGPLAAILVQPFVYLMNAGQKCERGRIEPAGLSAAEIQELRVICPPFGTTTPIYDSMVIHPSLNELTAWVLDKIDWGDIRS